MRLIKIGSDVSGSLVVPSKLLALRSMHTARCDRVLCLLDDIPLAVTITMVDIIVSERLKGVQRNVWARSLLLAVGCRCIRVA
jgi:hypothetical protein